MLAFAFCWLLPGSGVAQMLLPVEPGGGRAWVSDAHGLRATLPAAWVVCVEEHTNHGFVVMPDGGGCGDDEGRPRVAFWVSYNLPEAYRATPALRRQRCGGVPAGWSELWLAGARTMHCRVAGREQWFALRRRPGVGDGWTQMGIDAACPPAWRRRCAEVAARGARLMRGWQPRL